MNELGKILRQLRGKKSLREAAELTGLSHTYISDIEKGYKHDTKAPIKPSPDTLKMIAKAYNYSYDKLMKIAGYIDSDQGKDDGEMFFWDLENVTPEEIEEAKRYIEFRRQQLNKKRKNEDN